MTDDTTDSTDSTPGYLANDLRAPDPDEWPDRPCAYCPGTKVATRVGGDSPYPDGAVVYACDTCSHSVEIKRVEGWDSAAEQRLAIAYEMVAEWLNESPAGVGYHTPVPTNPEVLLYRFEDFEDHCDELGIDTGEAPLSPTTSGLHAAWRIALLVVGYRRNWKPTGGDHA